MDTSLELLGATASAHGCTIAAWSEHALFLSWDGGQSFAQLAMTGAFQVAVGAARAVIVRDRRELAVVRPGDRDLRWSVLPGIARRDAEGDAPADPDHMVARELVASGRWTVVTAGKLIMASDDDGASWRYLPLPAERFQLTTLDDEGRLAAIAIAPLHPRPTDDVSGAPEELETRRYELQVAGGTWRTLPALRGPLAAATRSWSYVHDSDEFWGCGGSTKIVAVRGGRQHVLAGNLRDEIYHVSLAANAEVAFAGFGENLHRLVGAREETVAAIPADDLRLAAVDAGGLPLALARSRLVRWSPRGGWRRLLPAIGADLGAPSSPNQ